MDILLADDSALIRHRVKEALHRISGSDQIHEASTMEDALSRLKAVSPAVIILDLRMPDGSGMDVLKSVKALPDPPVVVVYTNYPYPQYRRKCMEWGADYFFDKSEDLENITDVIARMHHGAARKSETD